MNSPITEGLYRQSSVVLAIVVFHPSREGGRGKKDDDVSLLQIGEPRRIMPVSHSHSKILSVNDSIILYILSFWTETVDLLQGNMYILGRIWKKKKKS